MFLFEHASLVKIKQIKIELEEVVEQLSQFCFSVLKYTDIAGCQCILSVSITELYSGLMQLVTTSCFLNSESSHSLAIIS